MIKYLFMDVDGTLTDGQVYIGNDGELCKGFYVRDGLGIQIAIKKGIIPIIFTSRNSDIVLNRCKELGITHVFQGIKDKKRELINFIEKNEISYNEFAYIADDINDLDSMVWAKEHGAVVGCPHDSVGEIKAIAEFISNKNGGEGAVREFIEWLVENN